MEINSSSEMIEVYKRNSTKYGI